MFLAANAVKILEHKYQRAECSGFLEDLEQVQKVTSSVDSTTTWIKLNYVHQLGSDFSKSTNWEVRMSLDQPWLAKSAIILAHSYLFSRFTGSDKVPSL